MIAKVKGYGYNNIGFISGSRNFSKENLNDSITSRDKETADFFTKTILTVTLKAV